MRNGPYTLVVAPPEYPGKKYRGRYCYEHRLVWWKTHGTLPPIVHHENEKKRDNAPANLEGMTVNVHTAEHNRARKAPDVSLTCGYCERQFKTLARRHRCGLSLGRKIFYCSKSCSATAQHAAARNRLPS